MTCSGDQKVTTMILKVDLQCCQCYKKIKKILCKFPQIRDQIYNEKLNTVTITVVCCSPERVMDKLCCKARKTIKSIEIPKPKPVPAPSQPKILPTPQPQPAPLLPQEKPQIKKNGSKNGPAPAPKPAEEPPKPNPKPVAQIPAPKPAPPPAAQIPAPKPAPPPEPVAQWVPCYPPNPPPQAYPVAVCCSSCHEGRPGGPCYQGGYGPAPGYGRPLCPPGYYASPCEYFTQDNPSACSLM